MNVVTIIGVVAAYALVFMAAIYLCAEKGIHPFRRLRRKFAKLPFFAKLLVMCFGVTLFVHGSLKSPTNEPPRSVPVVQQITQEDVDQGFVLSGITTNSQFSILTPDPQPLTPSIITNLKWSLRGAYEDWFSLPADGWRFPFRDGWMDEPAICAWGEVRPSIGETNALPSLVPFQVSLAPEANWGIGSFPPSNLSTFSPSIFWHAVTPSNSLVATWQNALVERCPTNLVSFQAEFFADGRFEYRRQDGGSQSVVVESYTPVFPFDYDGDGLENSVDPEPYAAGPDAHGTNAEWYNAVCSNVLDAVEGDEPNEPGITWKDGIKTNAYYFVDVVASRGPAAIRFNGNVTNNLGNPAVVALTAATNHVPLLMGVDYVVTATADYEIILPGDGFAEITTNDEGVVHVKWPVNFYAMPYDGNVYYVYVSPADPGGEFVWDGAPPMRGGTRSSSSCLSAALGNYVSFGCGGNCGCGGCSVTGWYRYEGLSLSLPLISCGCDLQNPPGGGDGLSEPETNNTPSLSISFGSVAVIFEDEYEESPGQWVSRRSSQVTLSVSAYGGADGASLLLTTANMSKLLPVASGPLILPSAKNLSVNEEYSVSFLCEGVEQSGEADDVVVSGVLTPNGGGDPITAESKLTVVRVEIRPTVDPPQCPMSRRHKYGVCEYLEHFQYPASPAVTWNPVGGGSNVVHLGADRYQCPLGAVSQPLVAEIGSTTYTPLITVVEPQYVSAVINNYVTYPQYVQIGQAGGIGMALKLYVTPLDVSFVEILIQEVATLTYDASGYFTNPYFNGNLAHTIYAGAGRWLPVSLDNQIGSYDTAAYVAKIPWLTPSGTPTNDPAYAWTGGYVYIDNPFGWNAKNVSSNASPYKCFGEDIRDEIMLTADGTVGVRKLNNWVTRTTNGVIRLNGVLQP